MDSDGIVAGCGRGRPRGSQLITGNSEIARGTLGQGIYAWYRTTGGAPSSQYADNGTRRRVIGDRQIANRDSHASL